MEDEITRLFQEPDEAPPTRTESDMPGPLLIRRARTQDVDALGRLSADREGGDASRHAAAFKRALEGDDVDRTSIILVAEVDREIAGFGKVRFLNESRGDERPSSPEGWYLTGLLVDARFRRHGIGSRLTEERLRWIGARNRFAHYFSNARNLVSIALHERFGFVELSRGSQFAGVSFVGGEGVLFRVDLDGSSWRAP